MLRCAYDRDAVLLLDPVDAGIDTIATSRATPSGRALVRRNACRTTALAVAASPVRYRAKATAAVAATTASLCKSIGRGEGDANCRQRQEEV
jgi:hypothetical protein